MTMFTMSTRTARQLLFNVNSIPADNLRSILFDVEDQDAPVPDNYRGEVCFILTPHLFNVMKTIAQTSMQHSGTSALLLNDLLSTTSENFESLALS